MTEAKSENLVNETLRLGTAIIGGGRGCRAIIDLAASSFLKELALDIRCVVDPDHDAPGMEHARQQGIPTCNSTAQALDQENIDLVIELTGQDSILAELRRTLPAGVRLMDHTLAHIFWELANARHDQEDRLKEVTNLEERVETERRFLQCLFDTVPDLLAVFDKDLKVLRINSGFAELTGVAQEQLDGKTCRDLFAKTEFSEKCPEIEELIRRARTGEGPETTVMETRSLGEAHWEITMTPLPSPAGSGASVIGTWHRITDKVRLHREIESAEMRFKSFINSAHDWISIKDLDRRYVIVNPVCASALNHKPEEFVGRTPEEMLPADIAQSINSHDQEVIDSNRHQAFDEILPVDGEDRQFQTVRFPMHDYRGQLVGVCTIARDVTAERDLQDQLTQAAKFAAIGKLAAGVAHEINNPLTGVLAYAEDMIEDLPEGDARLEDLQVIVRETMRCRKIVRDLLDFASTTKHETSSVDLNVVIEESLSLIQKLPQFRNINIYRTLFPNLPSVDCDPKQLQQVFFNLLVNAADAMEGTGDIFLSTDFDSGSDTVSILVEDSGPGVPTGIVNKIFEPLFSTKGANGLGLSVSMGIIERHQGTITVGQASWGGAAFEISLPVGGKASGKDDSPTRNP